MPKKNEMFCKKCLNDYNGKKPLCNQCLALLPRPTFKNKYKKGGRK